MHATKLQGTVPAPELRLVFLADPLAVRAALESVMDGLAEQDLGEDDLGTLELVLAEVMNNIVEHAYAEDRGQIDLTIRTSAASLYCEICDHGLPMPGGQLPAGRVVNLAVPFDDLPEGGFGWFLIHELTQDLTYQRDGPCNRLRFRVALNQ